MKHLLHILVGFAVFAPLSAMAAPSYLQRDGMGGYRVTYDYSDHAKTGWYIGGNAGLSLLNWENKYTTDENVSGNAQFGTESFSNKPVFQGAVQIGRVIKYFWRAEFEAGWQGSFSDRDSEADFTMHIPYMMANGYYDFNGGVYLGAGLGVAMPTTTLDGNYFGDEKRSKVSFAGMGALYAGYSHKLDTHIVLDLRYRLSGITGFKQRVDLTDSEWFEVKGNTMMNNTFTLGMRYEF